MGMIMLKCPACGASIELEESREYGFCTYCGTKVMTDKVIVEHKGKVQIDNSENVERFLQNARRALEKEDWEEAEKYYNLVEQYVPYNMEAVFFSAYGKAIFSIYNNNDSIEVMDQRFLVLKKSISVINEYYELTNENKEQVLRKISTYIQKMYELDIANESKRSKHGALVVFNPIKQAFLEELKEIAIKHHESYIQELIKQNSYIEQPTQGCYIATAVYGSYDCPQVWTLRRYRDNALAKTWYGIIFIKCYYAISPTVVKWFGNTNWFNRFWRKKLDKWVKILQNKGYESTRYYDRY